MENKFHSLGPCPACPSSDACADYGDHKYCFSCNTYFKRGGERLSNKNFPVGKYLEIPDRKISVETCRKFGVTHTVDPEGKPISRLYPWPDFEDPSVIAGVQRRKLPKSFSWLPGSDSSRLGLFGQNVFRPMVDGTKVTVCEGAQDALAAYEINGQKWPAVAIQSVTTAVKEIKRAYEYLDAYDEIYFVFDPDGPGQNAIEAVKDILPFEKVRFVRLKPEWDEEKEDWRYPDVSDYREEGRDLEFKTLWYRAERYSPSDIFPVTTEKAIEIIFSETNNKSFPFPWTKLQDMTLGQRVGETSLWTSYPKVGKTEALREIEFDAWINDPDVKVGLFHIEDTQKRSLGALASRSIGKSYLDMMAMDREEAEEAIAATFNDERFILVDKLGSFNPDDVLAKIRYLAKAHDSEIIIFDNITRLFSRLLNETDERRAIDAVYSGIADLAIECGFHCHVVMHLNDNGQPRGSRGPLAVCHNHIEISRDWDETDPTLKRKRFLDLKLCRETGEYGAAGTIWLNPETGRMEDWVDPFEATEEGGDA